ncbi:efflux transporter outer membrane subunit [uncultured Ilyobacter sp.]|uniref:efflux transporter outer membrane subunit n=1 Tax=uncultured Ilyobacter sp. TaxID=544433 RepID=UPI0029C0DECE|nr:efflux transporter outer membrane subunit [uncultured Ilyobacter sp.]
MRGKEKLRLKKIPAALTLSAVLVFTGCTAVGPDYVSPKVKVPEKWNGEKKVNFNNENRLSEQWWKLFDDPMLDELIKEASGSNLDLKEALARVDEYRSRLGVVTGNRVPSLSVEGDLLRQKTSENAGYTGATNTYKGLGLEAGWEIDLFGRVRRSIEAAKANYEVAQEDKNDVIISINSRIALNYIKIRTYQARLEASNSNIELQREVLRITEARFKYGLATALEVAQAEQALASSEATVPPLRIQLSEAINTMAVLLGRNPGELNQLMSEKKAIPVPPADAAIGVPADILRQRPDIRSAERQLAVETARVGIAKADLYPQFSLSGSFGYQSVSSGNLFSSGGNYFSIGPSLRWNIFSGGSILNQIDVQDAIVRQKAIQYESTVLNALNEAENTMTAYTEDSMRLKHLEKTVKASKKTVELSLNLYKQGLVDFENVLNSQLSQFTSEDRLAQARGDSAENFVRLYAALGGGWDPDSIVKTQK